MHDCPWHSEHVAFTSSSPSFSWCSSLFFFCSCSCFSTNPSLYQSVSVYTSAMSAWSCLVPAFGCCFPATQSCCPICLLLCHPPPLPPPAWPGQGRCAPPSTPCAWPRSLYFLLHAHVSDWLYLENVRSPALPDSGLERDEKSKWKMTLVSISALIGRGLHPWPTHL